MKRFIALLTLIVLLCGIFQVPGMVFGEENPQITLKQAIEIAKKSLNLKTEGFDFNSSYIENQNGFNSWSLSWYDSKNTNESINISVDSSKGEIISVSWYTPYEQPKSRIPKHTKAEAQKAAEAWAAKLQGARFKQTRLNDSAEREYYNKFSDVFYFEFIRVNEGVDVTPNNITVQIDKNTLKLRYFTTTWDNQALTSKAQAFNLEKAKEYFKTKLGLELTYNFIYNDPNNEPKAVLAYTPKNGNSPIDAVSGELLNNYIYRTYYGLEKSANTAKTDTVVITPQEQAELEKNGKYITKTDAEQVVKQYLQIDENTKLVRANLYPGYSKTNATWNLEWNTTDSKDGVVKYIYAQIDAVTKEFISFNSNNMSEKTDKSQEAMEKEQAKKLAEAFLTKVQPDKFKKTQYREIKEFMGIMPAYQNGYSFNFTRVENGIPCPANSLNININQYTGEVISYSTNWTNISFSAPDNLISLDKAYDILFSKVKFGLQYIYSYKNTNDYESKEIKLAYVMDNTSVLIDAKNGQMINYDGTPLIPVEKVVYTDIKGNKAEEEINILIEMGILNPENSKFAPNSKMLQKDFIKLLMNAIQPEYYPMPAKSDSQYDNYYAEAIRRKIIAAADKKPNAYVTRQDAAKMIVRAMGYGVLAEKSSMFSAGFKDAYKLTSKYKGYAVMASELGIVTPIKAYFYPTTSITRGDAAEIIVNYLRCETSL